MRFVRLVAAAALGAALVAGCGGGGGDSPKASPPVSGAPGTGTVPPVTPGGTWLTLSPTPVAVTSYENETSRFQLRAVANRSFDKPFNVAIVDSKGVLSPEVSLKAISQYEYVADLSTAALASGYHETRLEVRLCEDDPLVCSKPLQGSPWYVPVSVNVLSPAQSQGRLALMPAALDLVTYQGEPLSFEIVAQFGGASKPVQLAVVDNAGILTQGAAMSQDGSTIYRAQLSTSSILTVGVHSASLEVRACFDDPRECRSPVSGSPWRVPTQVTVKSGVNLTTLAAIPGAAPWSTYNGNAAQNAYVPASFDPANFVRRWNRPESTAVETSAPVVDNGTVFLTRAGSDGRWELSATSEASGEVLWRYDLGAQATASSLAAANGRVFVTSNGVEGAYLWVLDQAGGRLADKIRRYAPYERHRAPTVVGDMVYLGDSQGMAKFDAATGTIAWENRSMRWASGFWTPAVDGSHAYAVLNDQLYALDTGDGSIGFNIQDAGLAYNDTAAKVFVLGDDMGIAKSRDRLLGFDLQSRTRKWVADTCTMGQPVLAHGTVYSLGESGLVLHARAAGTGILQWKSGWLFDNTSDANNAHLAVTSNLAFVSSAKGTRAVDLATQKIVWTYPFGGELAISDRGVLYIATSTGMLAAINLR